MEKKEQFRSCAAIFLLLVLGMGLRATFLLYPPSAIDADNALYGIMARHITEGEFPLFTYGQDYMGALESYVAAFFFLLSGASSYALRLSPYLFSGLFLAALYLLGEELYGRSGARWTLACGAAAPPTLLVWSSAPRGGYSETLFFGTLVLWLTLRIVNLKGAGLKEWIALGLAAGVGFWTHFLIVYYLVPSALILLWSLGRRAFGIRTVAAAAAFFVGSLPFWIYNIPRDFVSLGMGTVGTDTAGAVLEQFFSLQLFELLHLTGKHFDQIPRAGRLWPWLGGAAYLFLALPFLWRSASAALAFALRRRKSPGEGLFFLFFAVILFFFSGSRFGLQHTSRYILPLYSVIPFLGASFLARTGRWAGLPVKVMLCALMGVNIAFHFFSTSLELPRAERQEGVTAALLDHIDREGITEGTANYWLGWPLNFLTGEKTVFSEPVGDRLMRYQERVESSPRSAFLVRSESSLPTALDSRGIGYQDHRFRRLRLIHSLDVPALSCRPLNRSRWSVEEGRGDALFDGMRTFAPQALPEEKMPSPVTVDLGRVALPGMVRVLVQDRPGTLPGEWTISGSVDGAAWFQLALHGAPEHVFASGPRVYRGGMFFRSEFILDAPRPARYLKFERKESAGRPLSAAEEIYVYEFDNALPAGGISEEVVSFLREERVAFTYADRWESAELAALLGRKSASVPWNPRHHGENVNGIVAGGRRTAFLLPHSEVTAVREVLTSSILRKERNIGPYTVLVVDPPGEGPTGLFWTGFSLLYEGRAGKALWLSRVARALREEGREAEAISLLRGSLQAEPDYYLSRIDLADTVRAFNPAEGERMMGRAEERFTARDPMTAEFEGGVRLLGLDIESAGEGLDLTYIWSFEGPVDPGLWVFTHVDAGEESFQDDHPLTSTAHPLLMSPGNRVKNTRTLAVEAVEGPVRITVGLWRPDERARARVLVSDQPVKRRGVLLVRSVPGD